MLLLERVTEWNCSFWLGLVDYEKAFDTVEHEPLWNVLRENGVEETYVYLLMLLYANQSGSVLAGKESRSFSLLRGVKQGDPISGLLFIAVMESIFKKLKTRWHSLNGRRKGLPYGVVIDHDTDPLSNLRFADDVLLFATSQQDMAKMLRDLAILSATYGLKLHADKTIVLTNACNPPKSLSCGDYLVKVAASTDKEKYLGRVLCIEGFHEAELSNRIACAWNVFFKHKLILCNKRLVLKKRLRFFESVVTPTVLYGCAAWSLKQADYQKLRTTRRRMLRWMVGSTKRPDEDWIEHRIRAT